MSKTRTTLMAAALVAALFVGATVAASDRARNGRNDYQKGILPEVVVRAEMPRLVMPTVEVQQALRTLAMSGSVLNVN